MNPHKNSAPHRMRRPERHRPRPDFDRISRDEPLTPATPVEHVIRVIGLPGGRTTPFDGQWVKEYDPHRIGTDSDGTSMTAHLVTTADVTEALKFASFIDAAELWRKPSKVRRPDGNQDRPLTAFSCAIEPVTIAGEPLPQGWPFGLDGTP